IIMKSMHERKMKMAILTEGGFVTLPGRYGTLEEIFEVTTWSQLGIHSKPIILLNVEGYLNPLRMFIQDAMAAGYIKQQYAELITFVDAPSDCSQESSDWGLAILQSLSNWNLARDGLFQW
ncbi:lysine decarboxylase-domain-containing protein, partial [Lentinula aff. lateritia]